ncbi:MAG: exosortase/archaeosortase family protein [Paludibacteraceae bacterium]|nr:exosortase/archaeosortase family protein [Paludibacteraceae bacterium]MBP6435825.1 exosortase/archaeosortase family protein [Paludibacteraceae bacterium]MBP7219269.1 exosortase/archaeosortase family protein [Paludibacteraceae bacterium]MBP8627076.1 exosortase/archaeosortase family protein [Paludibacteraceae bacterium]MBP8781837.1 exosortase/archaeosortase family protein [Paludibacteraceae bacterium]
MQQSIKVTLLSWWEKLKPIHGVVYFVILLISCHFAWKMAFVEHTEIPRKVTFLWFDVTQIFSFAVHNLTDVVYFLLKDILDVNIIKISNFFVYPDKAVIDIVWSCSGFKQAYIFFTVIAFYPGKHIHKLWYIPLGLVVVYVFNVFRIALITYLLRDNLGWFDVLHEGSKYVFYAIIFLIWVIWAEKFNKSSI